jgi:hypothetical protein
MYLTCKDKYNLKVKGWEKIFLANVTWKQAEVAMPISDKANFEPKLVRKDKGGVTSY